MNWAVLVSLVMILVVVYVPFLQNVFSTEALGWAQWAEIIPLLLIPSITAEATKFFFAPKPKKS